MNLKKIVESLIDNFSEAGDLALQLRKNGLIKKIKSDNTPVSNGDLEVNKLVSNKISEITPDIPIISEETADTNIKIAKDEKNFWLIDPIDGTRDYINKRDEYTINAALILDLKPAIGIVFAPAKNRLFFSYCKNLAFEINNGKKIVLNLSKKYLIDTKALV